MQWWYDMRESEIESMHFSRYSVILRNIQGMSFLVEMENPQWRNCYFQEEEKNILSNYTNSVQLFYHFDKTFWLKQFSFPHKTISFPIKTNIFESIKGRRCWKFNHQYSFLLEAVKNLKLTKNESVYVWYARFVIKKKSEKWIKN